LAPRSERRIEPGQSRLLLLAIHPARPTLAEVPVADLSFEFIHSQTDLWWSYFLSASSCESGTSDWNIVADDSVDGLAPRHH